MDLFVVVIIAAMLLTVGTVLLGVVSVIASAMPAWSASRSDPMTALRSE